MKKTEERDLETMKKAAQYRLNDDSSVIIRDNSGQPTPSRDEVYKGLDNYLNNLLKDIEHSDDIEDRCNKLK